MSKKIKYVTEADVKKKLKIDTFGEITKDKVLDFISIIPNMDKDIAMSIINQFPAFASFSGEMVSSMQNICNGALEHATSSQMATIGAYQTILDSLKFTIEKDNISSSEREKITKEMVEIADKIAQINTEHKVFIKDIVLKGGGSLLVVVTALGAAIFGINVKGGKK